MKYRIVGNHKIDGHKPGGTLTITDEIRARRLQRGGHIKPAPTPKPPEEKVKD